MTESSMPLPDSSASYSFEPIAVIRSCYPERFGIPRQAGLVPSAIAQIQFENTEENRLSLRGIEAFSHLWVLFVLHRQSYRTWKPLVNPPRLGGNKSIGVYATRSPNRLNPIGMSAVKLSHMAMTDEMIALHIRGGDFLDQTPVLDVKPYVVYSDSIPSADSAWATPPEAPLKVEWTPVAEQQIRQSSSAANLKQLIVETLALDPRPGYERGKDAKAGAQWYMTVDQLNVTWTVQRGVAIVTEIKAQA